MDIGDPHGRPFVFQHGMGGDVTQPAGLFTPPPGVRLVALDCRGHGRTRPTGDPAKLCFDVMADDVVALLDHLRIGRRPSAASRWEVASRSTSRCDIPTG